MLCFGCKYTNTHDRLVLTRGHGQRNNCGKGKLAYRQKFLRPLALAFCSIVFPPFLAAVDDCQRNSTRTRGIDAGYFLWSGYSSSVSGLVDQALSLSFFLAFYTMISSPFFAKAMDAFQKGMETEIRTGH